MEDSPNTKPPYEPTFITGGVVFQIYLLPRKKPACLICYKNGSKRVRDTFKGDRAAAEKHCKELAKTITTGEGALHLSPLDRRVWVATKELAAKIGRAPDVICREYLEAVQILGPGGNFLEAAREWRRRHAIGFPKATVSQVVEELLLHLKGKKRDKSTIKSLRIPLRKFAAHVQVQIADVQTVEIERWLQLYPGQMARTTNNWINAVIRLFNFAKGRYIPKDSSTVADRLEKLTDPQRTKAVAIYQPWELKTILHQCRPRLRYLLALGAFAGLRTIELHRLDWSGVHLAPLPGPDGKPPKVNPKYPHGFIEVAGSVAKQHRTAARRIIPIQPNLAEWLEDARLLNGPVSHYAEDKAISEAITKFVKRLNVQRKKHRLPPISRPDNGARHSYGSYRLPVLGSTAALALEMNNSEAEIMRDYHELVHPDRVPEYWDIRPARTNLVEQAEFANFAVNF